MNKDSKIYVAGHRGLVGSALLRKLAADGYGNIVFRTSRELDLRRQADVESFFGKERPEYVFLAAAKVGGILANSTYKAEFLYDNLMIAANVIHASYTSGVKKLLNLGSSCIYPKFAPQPMKEEHLLTGALEPTNEAYSIAKISAIKLCRYYNEQFGTNYLSVMPTNLYGPGDNFDLRNAHVLPALMRKIHLAHCLEQEDFAAIRGDLKAYGGGEAGGDNLDEHAVVSLLSGFGIRAASSPGRAPSVTVDIWGTGEPYREFLFVDDLAEACLFLMEHRDYKDIGEFINIGAGKDITINDLAGMIRNAIGYRGEIQHDLSKPDGTPRKLLDVSRIRSLGWEPKTGLAEGIKKAYAWYQAHGKR